MLIHQLSIGGLGNTGILVNNGANLLLWSSHIVRCGYGINLQGGGNVAFATQDGRNNEFYWNKTALFIDNFYGTCDLNQDNIFIRDNTEYGIYVANSSGTVNISKGTYYNNTYCVRTQNGSANISGGDFHNNGWAIWCGGNVDLSGGVIHENYFGVLTDEANFGSFTMTGGSIHSNTAHAIQHQKQNDAGCVILGGSISGDVYLEKNDNYVNTNSSYPSFTVTPSTYYFRRKLVRTTNNSIANNEINNVTLTPRDSWYKYIDNDEYIILWTGGTVIVKYKDFYGNILKEEKINGTIGTNYSITPTTIPNYELVYTPNNASGTYTQNDIVVEFKYDLVNVAKVTFEDSISGVVSAKYWYNANSESFSGEGAEFINGTVFEKYGYYKVVVENSVGLKKELTFVLNSESLKR